MKSFLSQHWFKLIFLVLFALLNVQLFLLINAVSDNNTDYAQSKLRDTLHDLHCDLSGIKDEINGIKWRINN